MSTKVKRTKKSADLIYDSADLTISSKRQITIPSRMAKKLGLEPGGMLVARLEDGTIILTPRPRDWLEYITSSGGGVYGRTKEEVDAYIKEVRRGWDRPLPWREGDQSTTD